MALTVEQMLYGVWCHSTLRTDIWYAAGNAGFVTVQKPTVTRTQLAKSGTTDRGSRLSRGEISGGEAPRTLFGTKFCHTASNAVDIDSLWTLGAHVYVGRCHTLHQWYFVDVWGMFHRQWYSLSWLLSKVMYFHAWLLGQLLTAF